MQLIPCAGHVKDTGTPKGRGVFAARPFFKGDVVEICPVILVHATFNELPPDLQTVLFGWKAFTGLDGVFGMALGYGSLYNHDNPANLRYAATGDGQGLIFIADADIARGEELTINYNSTAGGSRSTVDNWFIDNKVTLYLPPKAGEPAKSADPGA